MENEIINGAIEEAKVKEVCSEIKASHIGLTDEEAMRCAEHELLLNARCIADTLAGLYCQGFEKLGGRPSVSLDKMPPDNDKLPSDAYYRDGMNMYGMFLGDGTIHLDRRLGKWHSLQLTAVHEFGHWLDFHSKRKSANNHDAFVKAGKADVENLFTIEDTAGKRKMTEPKRLNSLGRMTERGGEATGGRI